MKWFDQDGTMAKDQEKHGRYLGPSRDVGSRATSKILNDKGSTLYRSTFTALTQDELDSQKEKALRDKFDKDVKRVLGDAFGPGDIPEDDTPGHELNEGKAVGKVETVDRDDYDEDAIDLYLKAEEVTLPIAGEMKTGIVERRKRDSDGNLIGKAHHNPILDTRMYTVRFPDGKEAEYAANIIAVNMLSMCDEEGNQYLLLNHIVDHKKEENAVPKEYVLVWIRGRKYPKKTTKGWKLCVEWKDGTTSWVPPSTLKKSNPVEIAEYTTAPVEIAEYAIAMN
jgi:hypothetical protein